MDILSLEINSFLHIDYCGVIRYGDENSQTAYLNLRKIEDRIKAADWGYERASAFHIMREKYNYPVLSVDRPYNLGSSGQLRTRVQAFVESIEIKKIQKKAEVE